MDQVFIIKHNIQEGSHTLSFYRFKQAYDSIKRDKLYQVLEEFNIHPKLISLIKMTLEKNGK